MTKQKVFKALFAFMFFALSIGSEAKNYALWYNQPAREWMEAMPMGNGRLGAMVYGGIYKETIALNEISLWAGQKDEAANILCGADKLAEMRGYFFADNPEKGNELGETYLKGSMKTFGTHVPLGDLNIDFTLPKGLINNYRRELSLDSAVATVTFACNGVNYRREYIVSYPDNVIAMKFTADQSGKINARLGLSVLQEGHITASNNGLQLEGKVNFDKHGEGGVMFCSGMRIVPNGGKITYDNQTVTITGANDLTVIADLRTNYNDADYKALCAQNIEKAVAKQFNLLKDSHIKDYSTLYNKMDIELGDDTNANLATDIRLSLAQSGGADPDFDALFFQYGRYMLISSSRPNSAGLCANLQGIWNDNRACNSGWTCDYHLDINIQQNYWAANRANLAECNEPLFDYLQQIIKAGTETARKMYGADGWVAHTVCNAWGYTAPGNGVGWGMNVTGGAWLATHLWSHYLYTQDKEFLRETGYPMLRQTAQFFMSYMVTDPRNGYLVTGPSISPENNYISAKGNSLSLSMMPTIDRDIVYDIYNACIQAEKILGTDKDMRARLEKDIKRLPPLQIGADGQIQEWLEDVRRSDPSHRHSSHLLALFPLNQISYTGEQRLISAAEKGLKIQTSAENWEDTEWSTANMICFYSRMKDAERSYDWVQNLFKKFTRSNLMTVSPAGVAGVSEDIFSFDATEASVAGMCEMLLQSYDGYLDFLPALPKAWANGRVRGLCAEGGIQANITWKDGKVSSATLISNKNQTIKCKINGEMKSFKLEKDKEIKAI